MLRPQSKIKILRLPKGEWCDLAEFTSRIDENGITRYYRNGIELEKGIQLTEERI